MDMHPSGFPGFVGPEGGSGFNHFDLSSHFRILPNTSSSDSNHSAQDSLSLRSMLQPPHLQACRSSPHPPSPSSSSQPSSSSSISSSTITSSLTMQPLRLAEEICHGNGSRNGSPRLSSPPSPSPFLPSLLTSSPGFATSSKSTASACSSPSSTTSPSSVLLLSQERDSDPVFLEEI